MDGMMTIGLTLMAIDKMSNVLGGACDKAIQKFSQMQEKIKKVSQDLAEIGTVSYIAGQKILGGVTKPIAAFADLEEAQKRLRTLTMDATGAVGKEFDELMTLADRLGTSLPGSTKDMVEMFISLREQGVQTKYILGGAGEAAAKFAVLMRLPFAEGAVHAAKMQEVLGVADNQMTAMMDKMQRLKFASGIETGDLLYTFKYLGASLKNLDMQGLDKVDDLNALLGVFATNAQEGSQVGTNFAHALSKMAEIGKIQSGRGLKAYSDDVLSRYHIKLNFWDEKGQFLGVRNMVQELEKLRALNPRELDLTLKGLFDAEGARMMSTVVKKGVAGLNEMQQRMQHQADMQKKINEIMSSTKMQWDTLSGTVGNFIAHLGGAIVGGLRLNGIFSRLNDIFGKLDVWVMNHQKLAGALGAVVAIGGVALVVFGGLAISLAVILKSTSYAIEGFTGLRGALQKAIPWVQMQSAELLRLIGIQRMMEAIQYRGGFGEALRFGMLKAKYGFSELITGIATFGKQAGSLLIYPLLHPVSAITGLFKGLGAVMKASWSGVVSAIRAVGTALRFVGFGSGMVGLFFVIAALMIIKCWQPIKAFFSGLWEGIKEGLSSLREVWKGLKAAFEPLSKVLSPLIGYVKDFFKPFDVGKEKLSAVAAIGRVVGIALSFAFTVPIYALTALVKAVAAVVRFIWTLPQDFRKAGENLMKALGDGIKGMISAPINAVTNAGSKIISSFKTILGIHSPSRVFTDFGFQIAQGAALGINKGLGNVNVAARTMVQPILQPIRTMPAMAGAGGGVVLNYSPTVNINGASAQAKEDFAAMLKRHKDEILKMVEQHQTNKGRVNW